ncbi:MULTISPECIES: hypothetical protein [Bacillus]|nr:hypothetical protein [Bacillus paranthracis]MDF9513158.1 hypothetical protein [Bacillus paranthracis]MDF9671656.1 hypothetical protein [Bacillus paranthracis]
MDALAHTPSFEKFDEDTIGVKGIHLIGRGLLGLMLDKEHPYYNFKQTFDSPVFTQNRWIRYL